MRKVAGVPSSERASRKKWSNTSNADRALGATVAGDGVWAAVAWLNGDCPMMAATNPSGVDAARSMSTC